VDLSAYREIISGRRRGPAAGLARCGLAAASLPYAALVRLRNRGYDSGALRVHRADVPVVSVGNLTAGGTGKTPLVAALVARLRARGLSPVILSRGYRAPDDAGNDEKLVLDQLCPGTVHLQGVDRVSLARRACSRHAATVLVLDDGFQHRRLARDLDLVLLDALDPWGGGRLLPRGLLREPTDSLKRADLVVLTRIDQCPSADRLALFERVRALRGDGAVLEVAFSPTGLVSRSGERVPCSTLENQPIAAFCGIGNPDAFRRTLSDAGLPIGGGGFRVFPDHHAYRPADLESLAAMAAERGAAALVTTQKDLVKIDAVALGGLPLWALTIEARFVAGEDRLEAALDRLAADFCHRPPR
jgi:tetraacyldisaccharide 4'-kinase